MINFSDLGFGKNLATHCEEKDHREGNQEWLCVVTGFCESEYGDRYNMLDLENPQNNCSCTRRNDDMEVRRGWIYFLPSSNSFVARRSKVRLLNTASGTIYHRKTKTPIRDGEYVEDKR